MKYKKEFNIEFIHEELGISISRLKRLDEEELVELQWKANSACNDSMLESIDCYMDEEGNIVPNGH